MRDDASKQKLSQLCDSVANEQDQHRLSDLVNELIQLLDLLECGSKRVDGANARCSHSKEL